MQALRKLAQLSLFLLAIVSVKIFAATPVDTGFVSVDRGQLYYEKYGSGPAIIVLHGGPGLDQEYLKPQLLELAKNHTVVFYDQRGSGKSLDTVMDRSYINLDQFVEDVEAVRVAMHFDKVEILGHSWGGLLAMSYAIKYPQSISKLILVDSMPADLNGILAAANEVTKRTAPFQEELAPLANYDELAKLNSDEVTELYRKLYSVYFKDPADVAQLNLKRTMDSVLGGFRVEKLIQNDLFINLIPALQKLKAPTTVVIGDADVVPLWTSEAIAKAIPNAKLFIVHDSGHFPFVEKPDVFFHDI